MSYVMLNMKDDTIRFHCSTRFWSDLLDLAQAHGWQPQGARLVDFPNDDVAVSPFGDPIIAEDTYQFDIGFFVTDDDAVMLVKACERALNTLENTGIKSGKMKEFIEFARHGAFCI